jgi:hypothetical protein
MDWEITFCRDEGVVHITVHGTMNLQNITAMSSDALTGAASRGMSKFLLNAKSMVPEISALGICQLPLILHSHGLDRTNRVAIVYSPAARGGRDFEFFETVAVNRAFSVRVFPESKQAEEWLKS